MGLMIGMLITQPRLAETLGPVRRGFVLLATLASRYGSTGVFQPWMVVIVALIGE